MKLLLGQLLPADAVPKIRSIIGRVSIPGSIFVEALDVEAVSHMCKGLRHIRVSNKNDICKISSQDAKLYLREHATYTPSSPGWVWLKKKPYKGDISFVFDVEPSLMTTLSIIPRIPADTRLRDKEERKRYNRPPQALFDPAMVRACYGERSVEQRNIFSEARRISATRNRSVHSQQHIANPRRARCFRAKPTYSFYLHSTDL